MIWLCLSLLEALTLIVRFPSAVSNRGPVVGVTDDICGSPPSAVECWGTGLSRSLLIISMLVLEPYPSLGEATLFFRAGELYDVNEISGRVLGITLSSLELSET